MQSKAVFQWISGLVFLVLCLQPGVLCENLMCYFCPLTSFNKTCKHTLSECPPQQLCFTADGRFGWASLLFSKGCMTRSDCARSKTSVVRGNNVTFTYSCCSRNYCNSSGRGAGDPALLTVTAIAVSVFAAGLW
ncbi:protein Bouncer-like [Ctenopharyngodon idella]|uniref:protein Bouncer-like n=1 Tax=Ctenopharyngodon idella TaxID=7959 RepID=UPI00222F0563|nr:protein Bouncer-like [Ctenopharyngodon idella]